MTQIRHANTIVRAPIASLTGLRFVAAMCVVVSHALESIIRFPVEPPLWYTYATQASAVGMTLFFVLSGFVIHYNYSAAVQAGKVRGIYEFFVARFARLYPLYIVCFMFSIAATWWYGNLHRLNPALPYYLTLTQTWLYDVIDDNNLIYQYGLVVPVTWSISTEWFFYVAYPVIGFLILRLPGWWAKLISCVVLSFIVYSVLFVAFTHYAVIDQFGVSAFGPLAGIRDHWLDSFIRWLVYFSPYSRIGEFVLGCLTAAVFMELRDRPVTRLEARLGAVTLVAALAGIGVLYHAMFGPPYSAPPFAFVTFLHMSFGFAPLVAIVIFCSSRYHSRFSAAMSAPFVVQCGEISYSLYLLHVLVIRLFVVVAAPVTGGTAETIDLAWLAADLGITIAVSFVSYSIWEDPMRRLLRRALLVRLRSTAT